MTQLPPPKSKPGLRQRQAAALRENLKRRKAQEKHRAQDRKQDRAASEQTGDGAAAAHDSAGIGADKRNA
jgi:hypothetical protein